MYNWSTDIKKLKKHKDKYRIWKMEQMINFGLQNEKLNKRELKKIWPELNIDKLKKKYLAWLLWPQKQSEAPISRNY
jgi:hypothetical protein